MKQLTMFAPTFDQGTKTVRETALPFDIGQFGDVEFQLPVITLQKKVDRYIKSPVKHVRGPEDSVKVFAEFKDRPNEHLVALYLDTKNTIIGIHVVSIGNINSAVVSIAEVFRPALVCGAAALVIGHNHPSGDPTPSPEDINVTRLIKEAGELLEISLLDHVIFGSQDRYVSLRERGFV